MSNIRSMNEINGIQSPNVLNEMELDISNIDRIIADHRQENPGNHNILIWSGYYPPMCEISKLTNQGYKIKINKPFFNIYRKQPKKTKIYIRDMGVKLPFYRIPFAWYDIW